MPSLQVISATVGPGEPATALPGFQRVSWANAASVRAPARADARQGRRTGCPTGDGWLFEPKWDGFRAHRLPRRRRGLHPEPRPQAARPLLPGAGRAAPARAARALRRSTARSSSPATAALDFEALLLRIHPAASRVKMLAERVAGVVRRLGPARARRRGPARDAPGRAARAARGGARAASTPPIHLTPGDPRPRAGAPTGSTGSRAPGSTASSPSGSTRPTSRASGRCSRSSTSARPTASSPGSAGTRTARDARRLAAARPVRRRGHAPPRRHHLVVHVGPARRAGRGARAAARERARGPPLAGVGRVGARATADASGQRLPGATSRWNRGKDLSWEPLRPERVVRGRLRPPPGRPIPPRDDVRALAARQAARGLPLRPARDDRAVRAVRRSSAPAADAAPPLGPVALGAG